MAETITAQLAALADITTMNLYLHNEHTGALLNGGGDALIHVDGGMFQAVVTESRDGLGHLYAVICDGAESTANLLWDGWLPAGLLHLVDSYPSGDASLAKQDQILAEVKSLGSNAAEAY